MLERRRVGRILQVLLVLGDEDLGSLGVDSHALGQCARLPDDLGVNDGAVPFLAVARSREGLQAGVFLAR